MNMSKCFDQCLCKPIWHLVQKAWFVFLFALFYSIFQKTIVFIDFFFFFDQSCQTIVCLSCYQTVTSNLIKIHYHIFSLTFQLHGILKILLCRNMISLYGHVISYAFIKNKLLLSNLYTIYFY